MKYSYFLKIKRRLLRFAKSNHISVKFISDDDQAANHYIPRKKQIVIRGNQSNTLKICVLLHELGHFLDYKNHPERFPLYKKVYESAFFYNGLPITKKQKHLLILAESRAWNEAKILANERGINLGKWFFKSRKKCMAAYRKWPTQAI